MLNIAAVILAVVLGAAADVEAPDLRRLERLLRQQGALLDGLAAISGASSQGGRTVVATRDFQEGDLVLQIPRRLCIQTPQRPDASDTAAALAQQILDEGRRGAASPFQLYLQLLPPLPPLHPLATQWPVDELRGTVRKLYREAQSRFAHAEDEDLRWALGMVWTRAFAFGTSLAMVPYLDFFNHWIPQRREDLLWNCRLQEWGSHAIGLVADRHIVAGEELNHVYSEASDAQLLVQHGIAPATPSANPWNEALLQVDLPEDLQQAIHPLFGGDFTFQLPSEAKRLQRLAALVAEMMVDESQSNERLELAQTLWGQWLLRGEAELAAAESPQAASRGGDGLSKALRDIAVEEAAVLQRLRANPPAATARVL